MAHLDTKTLLEKFAECLPFPSVVVLEAKTFVVRVNMRKSRTIRNPLIVKQISNLGK